MTPNDDLQGPTRDVPPPLDYVGRLPRYARTSRLATACPLVAALSFVLIAVLAVTTVHIYVFFYRFVVTLGDIFVALSILNLALPVAAIVRINRSGDGTLRGGGRAAVAPLIFFGACALSALVLFLSFQH
jgi:hypothetical protein